MSSDYQDPCELSKALEHLAPNATSLLANWTPVNCPEEDDYYPDLSQIAVIRISLIILYLTNMALALLGNAAVCWTVLSNRKMQTVVNYYIVNLAACDFMVGAFVLPVKLLELTAPAHWNVLNDGLCTSALYSQTVCVFASILTLVATCLERYFAIVHPLESRIQQSKSRTIKILAIVWTLPMLGAVPYLFGTYSSKNTLISEYGSISRLTCFLKFTDTFRRVYFTFLFVFFYAIPLTFIGWTCLRITQCLLRSTVLCRESSLRRQEANRRKVAKMVLIVVAAFAISWTPYFAVSIVTQYMKENYFKRHNYFFTMLCINLFAFINSSINPFIYATMSTRFRNGFAHLFRFVLCAPREMAEDNGQLLHGQQHGGARGNSAFATIQKYHRQMILLACGEPTQISTDSLPMESQHTVQGSVTHLRTPKNEGHHHHHRHHRNDTALNQLTKAAMLHLNPISSAELKSRSLTWFDLRDVQSNGSAHVRTLCPSDLHDHNGVNLANGCHRLSRSFSEMALPVLFKGHNNAVPMASDGQPELVSPANPSGQVDVNGQLSKGPLGTSCIRASRFGHLKCSTKENVPLGQTYATKGSSCDLEHLAYIDSEV